MEERTFNERFEQAVRLHHEGVDGSETAVQQANRLFAELRVENPNNQLLDAYYGSTMILIARDKSKAMERLKLARSGLKLLDQAVTADPQNITIRMLRGKNAYHLPEKYLQRTQTAIEDYTFVIHRQMRQGNILEPREYAQLLYELGDAYQRIGNNKNASICWKKLQQQSQDPKLQSLVAKRLQAIESKPDIEASNLSPTSLLMGKAAQATGNALIRWAEKHAKEAERKRRAEAERMKREKKSRHR